jgi:hypothetical protein
VSPQKRELASNREKFREKVAVSGGGAFFYASDPELQTAG